MTFLKTRLILIPGVLLLVVAGMVWAYMRGRTSVLITEFKVYHGNIVSLSTSQQQEVAQDLREFMKARYYYLGNRIPKSWIPISKADHGPVNTKITNQLVIGKGPTTPQEEYRKFLIKIGQ
jgi:hypothetical protein